MTKAEAVAVELARYLACVRQALDACDSDKHKLLHRAHIHMMARERLLGVVVHHYYERAAA